MYSIIIAFTKQEDADRIRRMLVQSGIPVELAATLGTQVVGRANELDAGLVISSYRLSDMSCFELNSYLPKGFEMLLIAAGSHAEEIGMSRIKFLPMPFRTSELISAVSSIMSLSQKKNSEEKRSILYREAEERMLNEAKALLMKKRGLSEEEAHRFIQKKSMDSGRSMLYIAKLILDR